MSENVISLFDQRGKPSEAGSDEADGPHVAGPCRCEACKHEWSGVAPVGVTHLECPKCHRFWGAFRDAIEPEGPIWRCSCGNDLFWLTPSGAMCRGCGVRSNDWAN